MNKIGERGSAQFDPRKLPHDVAQACVVLAQVPEFQVLAGYLDQLCDMYTANTIWTPDGVDVARGRAQAINGLLIALADAPNVARRPVKK